MRDNARTRLAALREKKPPTKAAQIRKLWPEIKAALDNGHSLNAIAECLAADGIDIDVRRLSVYIGRIRSRTVPGPTLSPAPQSGLRRDVTPAGTAAPAPSPPDAEPIPTRDPLANVREMQKKRPGFDYRPELADPKNLI
jgi:hypothetical protein